jgi:hypothetical protein
MAKTSAFSEYGLGASLNCHVKASRKVTQETGNFSFTACEAGRLYASALIFSNRAAYLGRIDPQPTVPMHGMK